MIPEKTVRRILQGHGLEAESLETSLSGRFYSFPARNKRGRKYWVKVRNSNDPAAKKEMRKEVAVTRLVSPALNDSPGTFRTMKYLNGEEKSAPEWLIYEFVPGSPPGDALVGFDEKFLTKKNIDRTISTWKRLKGLDLAGIEMPRRGPAWFRQELERHGARQGRSFPLPPRLVRAAKKYVAEKRPLMQQAGFCFCHGDAYPQNFLRNKTGYFMIDWGMAHLNSPAFDPATIWFSAWKDKKWQSALLDRLLSPGASPSPEGFRAGFTAVVARQTFKTCRAYSTFYDHPEKWVIDPPKNEKEYFPEIRPVIARAHAAHVRNLEGLLAK